ncbi:LAQU0S08e03796g1_1 [Lachancea quebecensis]|uniref:RNA helicase n=1 Tax=Lachancea quebecensis TaxID=1654605 RepID=A0A0P1KTB1_9SACH|nr:LAQU0S08e03796g1_1 [Lachancea quebecensis]
MASLLRLMPHPAFRGFNAIRCSSAYARTTLRNGGKTKSSRHSLVSAIKKGPARREKKAESESQVFHYGAFGGLREVNDQDSQKIAGVLAKVTDFDQLKILPEVRHAVKKAISSETIAKSLDSSKTAGEDIKPSPVQVAVIQKLSKTLMNRQLQVHMVAAETGSGKTMAYLVPLFDYLKRGEQDTPESWDQIKDKAIVRSVILVPTHELVEQVYKTVKLNADLLGLHAFRWNMDTSYNDFIEAVKARIDILVTTPGKILNMFKVRIINRPERLLSGVRFAVLDEADTLMDRSWLEETHNAIKSFPNTNHLVFCSATIPSEFHKTMDRLFPTSEAITTPKLHKISQKIDFKLIDASLNPYKGSKIKALAQALYAIMKDGTEEGFEKRCLVFVNEKKDAKKVAEQLSERYGHSCVSLTGEDAISERLDKISAFVSPPKRLDEISLDLPSTSNETIAREPTVLPNSNIKLATPDSARGKKSATLKVLVTTDLMARGLNFQGVRNVILFDVPKTSIDLVHRAGRTGRMMQGGRVFMVIDKKTKSWAKAVPKIVRNNKTLS